jgi:hypothetical protein
MNVRNALILFFSMIVLLFVMSYISEKIKDASKTTNYDLEQNHLKTIDSLNDQVFILQSELGRYVVALEVLKEEDIASAQKFEKVLNSKTE